jgi:cell division protein ZapA
MADVQLTIAGRNYMVTCRDGEEAHLQSLGAAVDQKALEAGGASGGLNESRLLLFASLLLADELHDARSGKQGATAANGQTPPALSDGQADHIAKSLEKMADRIEALAAGLE